MEGKVRDDIARLINDGVPAGCIVIAVTNGPTHGKITHDSTNGNWFYMYELQDAIDLVHKWPDVQTLQDEHCEICQETHPNGPRFECFAIDGRNIPLMGRVLAAAIEEDPDGWEKHKDLMRDLRTMCWFL